MPTALLQKIKSFGDLIDYLRDELDWPLPENANIDNATFNYTAAELGLKADVVGGGIEFQQLRPLSTTQPWGIFFLNLPHKNLPQTLVRNILGKLTLKKRASANDPMRPAFAAHDLLFITSTGSAEERHLAFAHFQDDPRGGNAASLKVLGWEADDTPRRIDLTQRRVDENLAWPEDDRNIDAWRAQWSGAFTEAPRAAIQTSKDLAKTLAGFARRIRDRAKILIAAQTDSGSLVQIYKAFKEALIHDLTADAFADTYAQTVTYGLLSTAMSRASGALTQQDMLLSVMTTSPFLRSILENFIQAGGYQAHEPGKGLDFDELGVGEVVDFLRDVDMVPVLADFDQRSSDKDPVIHLYELFIHEYDKSQKFQRGVFYTPRQIVGFIVRAVHKALQDNLGLEDGLASDDSWADVINKQAKHGKIIKLPSGISEGDTFVRILDPATGTGTFLVEAIELIHKTMVTKWKHANKTESEVAGLWNDYVPANLLPRLYGFELMMAPYAIAHMKLGLKLWDTGYRFKSDARLRVHLTNALEPARDFDLELAFMSDAMAKEAKEANNAKSTRFTVIIGNPPYAGHSSNNNIKYIVERVHDYRREWPELSKPGQGKWLQDDYVKFLRLAQLQIDNSGLGVIGLITNHSYLDNPTFKGLRSKIKDSFSLISIFDLHGNVSKKEKDLSGQPDGGVFEDVGQGVAIIVARECANDRNLKQLFKDDLFGPIDFKLSYLAARNHIIGERKCDIIPPEFFFREIDKDSKLDWMRYASITDIFDLNGDPAPGIVTTHDEFAVSFSKEEQIEKIRWIVGTNNESQARQRFKLCSQNQWNYANAKKHLSDMNWQTRIVSMAYRPFDWRFTVYDRQVAVHLRDRVMRHMIGGGNIGLCTTRQCKNNWDVLAVDRIIGHKALNDYDINTLFPLWLRPQGTETRTLPNISGVFASKMANLTKLRYDDGSNLSPQIEFPGILTPKTEQLGLFDNRRERGDGLITSFGPRDIFDWIYAVLHSSIYRSRFSDHLKSDFARVPLPKNGELFQKLVSIGRKLVALHLLNSNEVPELKDPKSVRLAGSGEPRVSYKASEYETTAWSNGRMYISGTRWFETVPKNVADFYVGGYRPARKWLKDRTVSGGSNRTEGRILTAEDILHYRQMIVAMDLTIGLMSNIDEVIDAHGSWPDAFRGIADDANPSARSA